MENLRYRPLVQNHPMHNLLRASWVMIGMTLSLVGLSSMLPSPKTPKPQSLPAVHAPIARN